MGKKGVEGVALAPSPPSAGADPAREEGEALQRHCLQERPAEGKLPLPSKSLKALSSRKSQELLPQG